VDGLKMTFSEEDEELVKEEDVMLVHVEGTHKIFMIKS
jgi:hypothetical protein